VTVRLSAPQGHQYEVAHTCDNPVLYPAFLSRNRTVTRVLAKKTKVNNNFINGKKKFKRTKCKRLLSCFLVEGEKFKLPFAFEDFIFVVGFAGRELGWHNA